MNLAILSRNKNLYSTRRLGEAAEARGHIVAASTLDDVLNVDYEARGLTEAVIAARSNT